MEDKKTEMNENSNKYGKHVIITLNVSGLNKPIKRTSEWIGGKKD